jgi:hypothetical protein
MLHTRLRVPLHSNPFGDGNAATRAVAAIEDLLVTAPRTAVLEPA